MAASSWQRSDLIGTVPCRSTWAVAKGQGVLFRNVSSEEVHTLTEQQMRIQAVLAKFHYVYSADQFGRGEVRPETKRQFAELTFDILDGRFQIQTWGAHWGHKDAEQFLVELQEAVEALRAVRAIDPRLVRD